MHMPCMFVVTNFEVVDTGLHRTCSLSNMSKGFYILSTTFTTSNFTRRPIRGTHISAFCTSFCTASIAPKKHKGHNVLPDPRSYKKMIFLQDLPYKHGQGFVILCNHYFGTVDNTCSGIELTKDQLSKASTNFGHNLHRLHLFSLFDFVSKQKRPLTLDQYLTLKTKAHQQNLFGQS